MTEFEERMKRIQEEEDTLQFDTFTNDTAWELGVLFVQTAKEHAYPVTIDICRHGQQLFHFAMPGTTPDNDVWIQRKNRVVQQFHHSTYYMNQYYAQLGQTITQRSLLDEKHFAAHGGAFPITIRNVGVVGTITVSGLPQEEDHCFVVTVLKQFLGL